MNIFHISAKVPVQTVVFVSLVGVCGLYIKVGSIDCGQFLILDLEGNVNFQNWPQKIGAY